ncbi:phosphotriesterase [Streptomyces tateyamensis]|uniref:Phosphotriesterase n=1 Tax=Streptomyces tateyamensis TaxID=565073 RepID=A0A2V4MZ22_9ACTN|nr:phosphotriesterase [Streptomyces tateyamensis]PYC76813.1 phosphotriesterase [Streptomyces tateyamensis]
MKLIRTVLGDLDPAEFGLCNAHDHLFFRSALLPGQELDDRAAAAAELAAFRAAGGRAVVQWTPHGLGRHAGELPGLARESGVHLVAATGLHRAAHYERLPAMETLAELFTAELTEGITDGVRAGLIKVAGAFHRLDAHATATLHAAAAAHHATGAPIAVHHEHGSAAAEVLTLLCTELGVPASSVILGHLNRAPDAGLVRELAAAGAYLAVDGPSRANHATDWRLPELLAELVGAGHAHQLLLGGDTTTAAARSVSADGPGMPHLLTGLRPRLTRLLGEQAVELMLRQNPARAFAVAWRA